EVAVRTGCDVPGVSIGRYAGAELGDAALGRDPADPVAGKAFGEPDVAVRTGRNAIREVGDAAREFGNTPLGRDPANPAPVDLREPEVTVRPGHDAFGVAIGRYAGAELG